MQRQIETAMRTRGRFAYRELIVRPDGDVRTLDTVGEVVLCDGDRVLKLVGTCRDITEDARQKSEIRFYQDVFANVEIVPVGVATSSTAIPQVLRLVAFNPAADALTGGRLAGQLGRTMGEVFPALAGVEPVRAGPIRRTRRGSPDRRAVSCSRSRTTRSASRSRTSPRATPREVVQAAEQPRARDPRRRRVARRRSSTC